MPITRVPVVHRFGIVSHSKRLELHERMARKFIEEEGQFRPKTSSQRKNEFSIDEEFVYQFNEAEDGSEEKEELLARAKKIFNRIKRKAGLRESGIGSHVYLKQAWSDLSLLAQCNSRFLQEGALKCLYQSLSISPISRSHVESLLNLAHASINWLTVSNADQPYLRTGEVWLLKVAHLVLLRLYYHHLAGDIMALHEERMALTDIVEAFEYQQENYRPFPLSLLLVRVIIQIGNRLKSGLDEELKILTERDSGSALSKSPHYDVMELEGITEVKGHPEMDSSKESFHLSDTVLSDHSIFHDVTKKKSEERLLPVIAAIHDSSPTLWHALDSWRILTHTKQSINAATKELVTCSADLATEPFLDAIMAMHVLSEVCKLNHVTLEALQFIVKRDVLLTDENRSERKPKPLFDQNDSFGVLSHDLGDSLDLDENFLDDFGIPLGNKNEIDNSKSRKDSQSTLPDFLEQLDAFLDPKPLGKGNPHEGWRKVEKHKREKSFTDQVGVLQAPTLKTSVDIKVESVVDKESKVKDHIVVESQDVKGQSGIQKKDDQPLDDELSEQCSLPGDGSSSGGSLADLSSLASEKPTFENRSKASRRRVRRRAREADDDMTSSDESFNELDDYEIEQNSRRNRNMNSFSIEMGTKRAGQTRCSSGHTITRPNSQSSASITRWPWELIVSYVRGLGEICIHGNKSRIQRDALVGCRGKEAGLLQLLKFQLPVQEGPNADWSWRVRHVAVHELMRICQLSRDQPLKGGLRNAAWAALLSHHSLERDRRVLEAYKIARTDVDLDVIEDNKTQAPSNFNNSVYARISTNLAIIHLTHPESESPAKDDGTSASSAKLTQKSKDQFKGQSSQRSTRSTRSRVNPPAEAARVSLRDEIMIASTREKKQTPLGRRCWKEVQTVVEDQWRKELVEEYEKVDELKQKGMDEMMIAMRDSLDLKSLKERV